MVDICWRSKLSVGVPEIDQDHKVLIGHLNALGHAVNDGDYDGRAVARTLVELIQYTRAHFEREERLMARIRYPELETHKVEHARAVRTIQDLAQSFSEEPGQRSARELYAFVADWLVSHIIMNDMKLAPDSKGVWL